MHLTALILVFGTRDYRRTMVEPQPALVPVGHWSYDGEM